MLNASSALGAIADTGPLGGNPTVSADPAREGMTVVVSNAEMGWRESPEEVEGAFSRCDWRWAEG